MNPDPAARYRPEALSRSPAPPYEQDVVVVDRDGAHAEFRSGLSHAYFLATAAGDGA